MKNRIFLLCMIVPLIVFLSGCPGSQETPDSTVTASAEPTLPNGLLLSLAVLKVDPSGKHIPQPAELGILVKTEKGWTYESISDTDSNVFHKAMVYTTADGQSQILTAAGTRAILKLWPRSGAPAVLWEKDFGGKHSRMRDIEIADIYGDGSQTIVVATHDQGVVAVVKPKADGSFEVEELDEQPNTFVHEIEIGDLDHDGMLEIYATPSLPNKLDGTPQPGSVVRYVPAKGEGRVVVADLGNNHAKEILVDDIDGDRTDELYVAVEAVAGGQVEIRRYDRDTDPAKGVIIARLGDKLCRFLTAGDIDGDGVKEMIAAANKSGLWLLKPGDDPKAMWTMESIDRQSSGFEHAAILTDLDNDGIDELYVANDNEGEINRYVWRDGKPVKEQLYAHPKGLSGFTWNIMPVPVELIPNR